MARQSPSNAQCEECAAILREMADAWRVDSRQMSASAPDAHALRDEWLHADDDRFHELSQTYYTRTLQARRRKTEHEILTGHSVVMNGWRGFLPGRR